MKYLKKFSTAAEYTAAESSLILPNVSLVTENNTVHYNPSSPTPPTPPTPSHDYVKIGGVKWATMNVGATAVTDYGLYFQFGDTQGYTAEQVGSGSGQKYFDWTDYKYGSAYGDYTKYNGEYDMLQIEDDAVNAAWGGNWRMPTYEEFEALESAVTTVWTTDYKGSGVAGVVCTDKTDNSKILFFPAADIASKGSVNNEYVCIITPNLDCEYTDEPMHATLTQENVTWQFGCSNTSSIRPCGFTIRGILDE